MAVMPPVSDLSLAALARFSAGLPLPAAADTPGRPAQSRMPDVVVFSSAPMRVLSDLASAGLRQLAALLPMLEQAVQEESPVALAHLAKAAGAAARQIGEGHEALLAEGPDRVAAAMRQPSLSPSQALASAVLDAKQSLRTLARQVGAEAEPAEAGRTNEVLRTIARQIGADDRLQPRSTDEPGAGPIQRWLSEAKHLLRNTGDALERAEGQLRPLATEPTGIAGGPSSAWILTEILAAQAQVASAYAAVGRARATPWVNHRLDPRAFPIDRLAGATTLLGTLLIVAALWIVGGLWSMVAGIVALGGAAIWVWRISQASRGVTLDARA